MSLLHLFIVAVVQGITEFLPISSSAHLILVPELSGWQDQGLLIDIAVHVGTLGAVMLYFYRDVGRLGLGLLHTVIFRNSPERRLFLLVVLATLPILAGGYTLVALDWNAALRSAEVIAWATVGFGVLLYFVDRTSMTVNTVEHVRVGGALFIGLAQVLALIPGTSRSGITMTAARYLGFERTESARFSMLLSMPTILAAGTLASLELWESGDLTVQGDALIAAGLAFVCALAAIALMMRWLQHASYTPFVVYRLILGAGLLWWIYA